MTEVAVDKLPSRFWAKVTKQADGCWQWTGAMFPNGYGHCHASPDDREGYAHRLAYKRLVGPIPPGLVIDHLCRNRGCVNPQHMEVVSTTINILRGTGQGAINAVKTHCKRGHPFDEANTYLIPRGRSCRACGRESGRAYRRRLSKERKQAKAQAEAREPPATQKRNDVNPRTKGEMSFEEVSNEEATWRPSRQDRSPGAGR